MMGFMQEEELAPLPHVQQPKAGMEPRPLQTRFVHPLQFGTDDRALFPKPGKELTGRALLISREGRIRVRYIAIEGRRIFGSYPFEPVQEHWLIAGQMSNIVQCAPLAGVDIPAERLFVETADKLADGLVLMLKPGEDGW